MVRPIMDRCRRVVNPGILPAPIILLRMDPVDMVLLPEGSLPNIIRRIMEEGEDMRVAITVEANYRGPSPVPRAAPTAPPTAESKKARSSPTKTPETKVSSTSESTNTQDHGEVERLRAAAAQELTTEEVKPIQTDFHFFVKEHLEKYRKLAEEEVKKTLKDGETDLDPLLVNSNLNTRLMKAWEDLTKEDRDAYMVKEEADRRRFMEDDEIASRHCATLTARGKSPRVVGGENKVKKEDEETTEEPKRPVPEAEASGEETHESPTKKSKAVEEKKE